MKSPEKESEHDDEYVFNDSKEKEKKHTVLTDNNEEDIEDDELNAELISEKFNKINEKKIGKYRIIPILGTILGLFLIYLSIYLTNEYETARIIDNTMSGEFNVSIIIILFFGVIITIFSIISLFNLKNPMDGFIKTMNDIENNEISVPEKEEKKEVPLDEEKINIKDSTTSIAKKLRKPSSKKKQSTLDDIIPNFEKLPPKEKEEKEYKKAKLDTESIDDIYSE